LWSRRWSSIVEAEMKNERKTYSGNGEEEKNEDQNRRREDNR